MLQFIGMKTAYHSTTGIYSAKALAQWQDSSAGKKLLQEEQTLIAKISQDIFGYQLLVLSYLTDNIDFFDVCPVRYKSVLGTVYKDKKIDLATDFSQLPIATDSVDAVILQHTLDFSVDPRQLLREVERVLIPEGKVIICCFNPLSFSGLRRLLPSTKKTVPWGSHFISYPRLHDWLSLLGFDVEHVHCPTLNSVATDSKIKAKLQTVENYGYRFLPWLAGVYVVQAIKRVSTITPIRPKWHLDKKISERIAEPKPTTREIDHA